MSDIRTKCPLECVCKDETKLGCDDEHCIRHKAYEKGRADERANINAENEISFDVGYEKGRADEREKVLEGFEKYYINAEPEECATCDDVEPYGCFKCLLKKYKEQE